MTGPSRPSHPPDPVSAHQPVRPSWRCSACADAWPCSRRRDEMLVEYDGSRVLLALYLSRFFGEALEDHPESSAADLYLRFLGWFRDRPR